MAFKCHASCAGEGKIARVPQTQQDCGGFGGHGSAPFGALRPRVGRGTGSRDPAVPKKGSDAAVEAGWQFHPVTGAHGCKEQRSGVTTQDRRAPSPLSPPPRATNPRTGGQRPKKRLLMAGIPAVIFIAEARRLRVRGRTVRCDFTFILAEVSCLLCPTACRSDLGIAVLACCAAWVVPPGSWAVPPWLSRLGPGLCCLICVA